MLRLLDSLPLALFLLKATVLLLAATLIAAGLRRAPAGARYVVWLMTLAAVLLFPALVRWSPLRLEVLPPVPAASGESLTPPEAGVTSSAVATPTVSPALTPSTIPESGAATSSFTLPDISLWDALLLTWLAVMLALLGWLAAGALSVRRIVRGGRPLDKDPLWAGPLCEVADRLDLPDIPRLVASDRVEMPFACGVWRPTIVFPASADAWTDERRRVVLFHELAHIKRRDLLGHSLGRLACALYWFHPLVWGAARRLRDESERACDDLVLACGARASDYATHLLDIITSVGQHGAPATALPMARRREFEGRMLAILDPAIQRGTAGRARSAAVVAGVAALTLSVAAAAPASVEMQTPVAAPVVQAETTSTIASEAGVSEEATLEHESSPEESARIAAEVGEAVSSAVSRAVTEKTTAEVSQAVSAAVSREVGKLTSKGTDKHSSKYNEPARSPEDSLALRSRIAALTSVLRSDRDPEVRRSAVWGLAHLRGTEPGVIIGALRQDADPEVREMAAWALVGFRGDDASGALAAALRRDPNDEVRETAAWALGHHNGPAATVALLRALRDSSSEVRHTVVWALGHRELGETPKDMIALLDDRDPDVRLVTVWALTNFGDRAVLPQLRDLFASEQNSQVRVATFRGLAMMGDRSQEFIDLAMASNDPDLRAKAVRMLAGQGTGPWPWPWPQPRPRPHP